MSPLAFRYSPGLGLLLAADLPEYVRQVGGRGEGASRTSGMDESDVQP